MTDARVSFTDCALSHEGGIARVRPQGQGPLGVLSMCPSLLFAFQRAGRLLLMLIPYTFDVWIAEHILIKEKEQQHCQQVDIHNTSVQ